MNSVIDILRWLGRAVATGSLLLLAATGAVAKDTLLWNTNQNQVTADIKSAPLLDVLEQVASATGWQVFVEPETLHPVSVKFQALAPGEALRLLLGDANFALIPDSTAKTRLFVFRTSRQNATQMVSAAKALEQGNAPKVIPNELIVRLKPGAKIEEIAKALGAKVVGRIEGLNAYRLQFEDESAASAARTELTSNPDVASVENNYSIDRPPTPTNLFAGGGAEPQLTLRPPSGNGRVVVGLIDTGVQSLGSSLDKFLLKGISVAGDANLDPSTPTHGTAMAETILRSLQSITKGSTAVQILPIDVYGPNSTTTSFNVAQGIKSAVDNGATVLNLSLGSSGDSTVLHDVIQQAAKDNILLLAAKGNEPVTTPFYPAAYSEATAVTAVDQQGQVASYANRASIPSVGAPGTRLISFADRTYGVQGTSVSTAYASGLAAGYMDANQKSTTDARTYINNRLSLTSGGK